MLAGILSVLMHESCSSKTLCIAFVMSLTYSSSHIPQIKSQK